MRSLRSLAFLVLAVPLAAIAADPALIVRDVEYGRVGDVSLKLDVGLPRGAGPFPVAILVHGGGWTSGSKSGSDKPGSGSDITPWFATFTDAGCVWFSIDYRTLPTHRWPAQLDDTLTAIRWVKVHAAEYGGDPSRIVIVGHSAGGHIALHAAVVGEGDARVQAAIGYAAVSDLEFDAQVRSGASTGLQGLFNIPRDLTPETRKILFDGSPAKHIKPGLPPMLLLHGDADRTVNIAMTRSFEEKMLAAGNVCDVIVLPRAPHGLLTWDKFLPTYRQQVADWLAKNLRAAQ